MHRIYVSIVTERAVCVSILTETAVCVSILTERAVCVSIVTERAVCVLVLTERVVCVSDLTGTAIVEVLILIRASRCTASILFVCSGPMDTARCLGWQR